jgi:hypothetical protein
MNDGVATDYLGGSNGWSGGPHRNETLISTTISIDGATPVAYNNGQLYEGEDSIQIVRDTEVGISFYQTETSTLKSNSRRVRTFLERRNDGRTISPAYLRTTRPAAYQDFRAYDIEGNVLHDSSVTASDFTCDAGTVAVAQWNPTLGVMTLFTMTKGYELSQTWIIVYSVDGRRVYIRLDGINSLTNGQTLEAETITKHFETTAGEWKALSLSEVMKIVAPARSKQTRVSLSNLRLGL